MPHIVQEAYIQRTRQVRDSRHQQIQLYKDLIESLNDVKWKDVLSIR